MALKTREFTPESGTVDTYDIYKNLSNVYHKQPIFGLTQEWLRELSFSMLECGVHDKFHISSADSETGHGIFSLVLRPRPWAWAWHRIDDHDRHQGWYS